MSKKDLKLIGSIFLLSRLILVVFIIIKKGIFPLSIYDAVHYANIAQYGYFDKMLMAFFPLYPLLIRIVHYIIPNYIIAGTIISNVCSFISLIILNKLLKDNDKKYYYLGIFIFSPILAYSSICYTESLFMLLTLLGFYLYKKDKYLLSAIIIGLSILTRNSGIILWGAIGLDMLYRFFKLKNIKIKDILIFGFVALIIGLIYPVYLYYKTGDFLYFATVQNTLWDKEKVSIIEGIRRDLYVVFNNYGGINFYVVFLNWLSVLYTFILAIKIFKKDKVSSIYIIVSLIAFTSMYRNIEIYPYNPGSVSLFRYVFNLFPIYLYIFENKKEISTYVIFSIFLITSIFNAINIYSGIFIA